MLCPALHYVNLGPEARQELIWLLRRESACATRVPSVCGIAQQQKELYLDTTYLKDVIWVQPKTTGTASAGKTLLPTRPPAEAVSFCAHLFPHYTSPAPHFPRR